MNRAPSEIPTHLCRSGALEPPVPAPLPISSLLRSLCTIFWQWTTWSKVSTFSLASPRFDRPSRFAKILFSRSGHASSSVCVVHHQGTAYFIYHTMMYPRCTFPGRRYKAGGQGHPCDTVPRRNPPRYIRWTPNRTIRRMIGEDASVRVSFPSTRSQMQT